MAADLYSEATPWERSKNQFEDGFNYPMRGKLYDLADDPVNFYLEEFRKIKRLWPLRPGNVVCDIGCFNGQAFVEALSTTDTPAEAVGVDLYDKPYLHSLKYGYFPDWFRYVRAPAEHMPLPTNYANVSTANFMIYAANRDQALAEIGRITKPGGIAIFGTNGQMNMYGKHTLEDEVIDRVSEKLDIKIAKPPIPASTFYTEDAPTILADHNFEIIELADPIDQHTLLPITRDRIDDLIIAILTKKEDFPKKLRERHDVAHELFVAAEDIVRKTVTKAIEMRERTNRNRGIAPPASYPITVYRKAFVCINHN